MHQLAPKAITSPMSMTYSLTTLNTLNTSFYSIFIGLRHVTNHWLQTTALHQSDIHMISCHWLSTWMTWLTSAFHLDERKNTLDWCNSQDKGFCYRPRILLDLLTNEKLLQNNEQALMASNPVKKSQIHRKYSLLFIASCQIICRIMVFISSFSPL